MAEMAFLDATPNLTFHLLVAWVATACTAINVFGIDIIQQYEDEVPCDNPFVESLYDYRVVQQSLFIAGVGVFVYGAIPWGSGEPTESDKLKQTHVTSLGVLLIASGAFMALIIALTGRCQYSTSLDVRNDESRDMITFAAIVFTLLLTMAVLLTGVHAPEKWQLKLLYTGEMFTIPMTLIRFVTSLALVLLLSPDRAKFQSDYVDMAALNSTACLGAGSKINLGDTEHKRFELVRLAYTTNFTATDQTGMYVKKNDAMVSLAYSLIAFTSLEVLTHCVMLAPAASERVTHYANIAWRVLVLFNGVVIALFAYVMIIHNSVIACPLFKHNGVVLWVDSMLVVYTTFAILEVFATRSKAFAESTIVVEDKPSKYADVPSNTDLTAPISASAY